MRVIAGRFKGRRLAAPRRASTRPTQDRVREALFSILGSVEGERVLDLYAGSGALGIEALSRGAAEATFVDSDVAAVRAVRANLETLGVGQLRNAGKPRDAAPPGEPAIVVRAGVGGFLQGAARRGRCWSLVFCDPPYRLAHRLGPDLEALLPPVLEAEARIVCESPFRQPLRLTWPLLTERRYGDTAILVYSAPAQSAPGGSDER